MNEYIDSDTLQNIFLLLVTATVAFLCWMLETVWRNEKKKVLIVLILPISLLYFIYKYWPEMRFKCFFAALLLTIILLVSTVTKYNFTERIFALVQMISIWPYYVLTMFLNKSS